MHPRVGTRGPKSSFGRGSARGALAGVNAVVVGLLAAALWNPVLTSTIHRPADWALVLAAWLFLAVARLPPWLVVIGFAVATGALTRVAI